MPVHTDTRGRLAHLAMTNVGYGETAVRRECGRALADGLFPEVDDPNAPTEQILAALRAHREEYGR
jgi:hypothetical protein